jgi:hypothetical protein
MYEAVGIIAKQGFAEQSREYGLADICVRSKYLKYFQLLPWRGTGYYAHASDCLSTRSIGYNRSKNETRYSYYKVRRTLILKTPSRAREIDAS